MRRAVAGPREGHATDLPGWLCGLGLLMRAVLFHHSVEDGLVGGEAALLPEPFFGYSIVVRSPPGRVPFGVGGVGLVNGSEQSSCDRFDLVGGCFDVDCGHSVR